MRDLSERMFRPFRNVINGSGTCCGTLGAEPAPPLNYGPGTVVTPGAITVPPGSTTVIPPATESLPSQLEPIPSATPGPPASGGEMTPSQGAKSSTGKANYEAYRPRYRDGQSRANALAVRPGAGPEPTPRSAQGTSPADETNPLDNLPALDLPRDLSGDGRAPSASPAPAPAAVGLAELAAAPAGEVSVAPGLRRFAGLEPKLAGGSLPTPAGLDWLQEKGYKTILDLRDEADISPTFIADVSRRGMRYLALPITVKTVDDDHVARFNFEVSLAEARPLYFCDTDGTRAAVMWYIRRVDVDKVDPVVARRDAEELGSTDSPFWPAANAYLEGKKPVPAPVPSPSPAAGSAAPPTSEPAPTSTTFTRPTPPAGGTRPVVTVGPGSNAPPPPSAGPAPEVSADAAAPDLPRDPGSWKPIAALVVTGLGIPLAYVGRSGVAGVITLARASLPGPGRLQRSLPGGSDV
jgi:protein tyrosine phosphatase (PTP) superfamily phosphohydrolase (DUF442 family)